MAMPTGKMGWFMVKGQTIEILKAVGRTRASNSNSLRETVLYVVNLATVLLITCSMATCSLWLLRNLMLALALGQKTESWAPCLQAWR